MTKENLTTVAQSITDRPATSIAAPRFNIYGFGAVLLSASTSVTFAAGPPSKSIDFDIAPQSVESALLAFSDQADVQVMVNSAAVEGQSTGGVKGQLSVPSALDKLLQNTNLTHETVGKAVTVMRLAAVSEKSRLRRTDEEGARTPRGSRSSSMQDQRRSGPQIEEVIVTATKRAESVQNVPMSISVISAEDISQRGLVSAEDYLRGVPGVNQGSGTTGSSVIVRGIETTVQAQNFSSGPTVAIYFGETPITNSGGTSSNGSVDIKLVDIERVEVLRGPQGSAFGSSSLGGAVRTIPAAPKLDKWEAKVAAGYSITSGTGGDNFMVQGVGNFSLIDDRLAVRAVAYQFEDSGIYRNVAGSDTAFRAGASAFGAETLAFATDVEEVGQSRFTGARAAALLKASDKLTFTLSYLTQKTETDGNALTNLRSGPYDQAVLQVAPEHAVRGQAAGISDTDISLSNLMMDFDLGWANLFGTYSYVRSGSDMARPYSSFGKGFLFAGPLSDLALSDHRQHVAELRLTTQLDGPLNFLFGGYFEELEDHTAFPFVWYGDPTASPFGQRRYPGNQRDYDDQRDLRQVAGFSEVSWAFAPGWTLTGGGRAYSYKRTAQVETHGSLLGEVLSNTLAEKSDVNFRANLSYQPNDASLIYAGWAQGFRLGKPQPGLPPGRCDLDGDGIVDGSNTTIESTTSIDSDTVDSMEVGGKFTLLDRRLVLEAAIFRVDWNGMPFQTLAPRLPDGCALSYTANAGAARSEGIESQVSFQITGAWRLDLGGGYTRARLTKDVPVQRLSKGERLPGSPKLSGNLGLQYAFNVGSREAFIRADSIYVGSFSGALPYSSQREAGDYTKVDLLGGIAFDNLSFSIYARNLTGADNFVYVRATGDDRYRLRPRTIGFQLGYDFH